MAFNLADTYFVSRLGTVPLAALSFTFPVVMTVGSIAVGLGVGAASVISRAIGRGDRGLVRRLTTHSLLLAVVAVGLFCLVGLVTIDPLFRLLGADGPVLAQVRQYMQIWYLGMVFLVVPMVGNNALRAAGDTISPSLIMTVSATVNVVLDPILIFGLFGCPALGVRGAAIATVIARALSLVAALVVLSRGKSMLARRLGSVRVMIRCWGRVLYVGVPAAGMFTIIPISTGILIRMLAGFGSEAVAAFGIATRIESFAFLLVWALSTSMTPFVGQNTGAACFERVRAGLRWAYGFCLVWGLTTTVVLGVFGRPLAALFSKGDHPAVVELAAVYLQLVPISYGMQGISLMVTAAFNALGRPLPAAALTFLRTMIITVPLAWILKTWLGPRGVFLGLSLSNLGMGIVAYLWTNRVLLQAETLHAREGFPFETVGV